MALRIRGHRLTIREITRADVGVLHGIAETPEVARWWGSADFDGMLAIELAGEVVGAIEYYEELDPQYRHAGIDLFVDPRRHGMGIGSEAVRMLAGWLMREGGHHRIVMDPAARNVAAIRCYERAGFRRVGVMRSYERDPSTGRWQDGLLMDMLLEDLDAVEGDLPPA